jgi:2-polyprenyl-6-methoxyphenol hydroxylase-like FAD-dependent oxidoreductase
VTQSRARYLDSPVAIIGGGIGGLTAALSLQHFGVPVHVFEQARALREIGAGVTVTPNAMSVLDFLGIGSALAEIPGRAFAASQTLAEAFSRYEAARRDRANGVQLAARYQGTQHHGSTASGPSSGKTAATLGLFSYNPVTEPV